LYKLRDYITESENSELSKVDKKILTLIHDKVWGEHEDDPKLNYNLVEELRNLDEIFLYRIYDFLKNIMGFDNPKQIEYYIKLFINNFQEDGDYNKLTTQGENIIPNPNSHHQAVANSLNIPPILVLDKKETWDRDMSVFYDIVNDDHYEVGTEDETLGAINDSLQDRYYNFSEAAQFEGTVDGLISYLYIDDADKRIIASEYAESIESENHINDIIRMIKDYDNSDEVIKLIKRFYELVLNEDDPINSGIPKKVEIDQIEDSLRERLRELIYNDEYNKMANYIGDWLIDHGYISQDQKWGNYEFTEPYVNKWKEVDVSKLPKWLNFARDEFIEDQTDIERAGELSNIDDYYDTETIDGDTYYIIQIDY